MLLLRFYSAARLWPSLCCCVLFTAAFVLQSFYPLPLLAILAPFILFRARLFVVNGEGGYKKTQEEVKRLLCECLCALIFFLKRIGPA